MHRYVSLAASLIFVGTLLFPLAASAVAGIPIGGKVVGIIPCPHLAGYDYVVAGFGIGSGVFWYVPGTITYPFGPPVIGAWILGLAEPAGACAPGTLMEGIGF